MHSLILHNYHYDMIFHINSVIISIHIHNPHLRLAIKERRFPIKCGGVTAPTEMFHSNTSRFYKVRLHT